MTEIKPGYKQTDVGVIPDDWDVPFMGKLAQIQRGASPRPISSPIWFDNKSSVGWLRISDVSKSKKYLKETTQHLSKLGIANSRYVTKQNLLMSICATVGKPVITHKNLCIHDGFVVFDQIKADREYVYYVLSNIENDWAKYGQTGSQMNLNTGLINNTRIPLPKLQEQKAIAKALSDVDNLIEGLEQLIDKKRDMKTAAMDQLLTGKKRLPGFDSEWKQQNLEYIADFYKGKFLPKSSISESGKVSCIHYGELFTQYSEKIKHVKFKTNQPISISFLSKANDVLMPTSDVTPNGLAKASCVLQDGLIIGGDILVIRAKRLLHLNGVFLSYFIRFHKNEIMKRISGTTVYHLYASDIKNLIIYLPNFEEQNAIVSVLENMNTEIDTLEQRLTKILNIKTGMMQELLTGKTRLIKTDKKQEAS